MSDIEASHSSEEVPWGMMPNPGTHTSKIRASLKGMATYCKVNAQLHGDAAKKHKSRYYFLQTFNVLITAGAAISATISVVDDVWAGQLVVAILSSSSAASQSILGLLNPDARSEKHLSTEHRYTCLARDIMVKLVSRNEVTEYWEDVMRDSQRLLDGIQAVEPDL